MTTAPKQPPVRAHIFVSGRVQGVYFRAHTLRQAQKLKLSGWVRNLWDGRLEVVFEGEEKAVQQAVNWCHVGPSTAQVSGVEVQYEQPTGEFDRFRVIG
jgi:acylphosphatase